MKDRFTRVLKGHIAIATAIFPNGHHAAPSSTASRGAPCGKSASITPTGPAMASALILSVHEGRSASRQPFYPGGQSLEPLRGHVPVERARLL